MLLNNHKFAFYLSSLKGFSHFCKKIINLKNNIKSYFALVKFSHTIFALPFALIGFFTAIKQDGFSLDWTDLILVLLCMIFARNSAMAFNRYIDRFIDKANPRTAKREIPDNKISSKNALLFTIINSLLFIAASAFINKTTLMLSPVALAVVLVYSYTKRFTFLSHLVLGIGLAIAPAGAYIAVSETLSLKIILLSSIVLLWTAGFDIIYSLQDEEFDKQNGLFSIPAKFGRKRSLIISSTIHLITIGILIYWTFLQEGNFLLWIGVGIFTSLLIYQHLIVKPNDISKVNLAFGTTNGIASVCLATFTIISFFL